MSATVCQSVKKQGPLNILSLDAGGPQGVSQLCILNHLIAKLSTGDNGELQGTMKPPCEIFDIIGGTGTGGLIAIFLAVFKMTAKDALEEFSRFVVDVYEDDTLVPEERTEKLQRTVQGTLKKYGVDKDTKLVSTSEALPSCKLMVPVSRKNESGVSCLLTNYVAKDNKPQNTTIADAMLATCSFSPAFIPTSIQHGDFATEYISGDLGLGNPTREVIAEACRIFGDEKTVKCILSIGCGHPGVIAVPSDLGATTWIRFLEQAAVDRENTAREIGSQMSNLTIYYRMSVGYGLELRPHDWTSPSTIAALTTAYLEDSEAAGLLKRCIDEIKHGGGFTSLEKLRHAGGPKLSARELASLASIYVERKTEMDFVENALFNADGSVKGGPKIVVVTGIGGCGKTYLIRKFVELYRNRFASTFFIEGSSSDSIKIGITRNVRSMSGPDSQSSFDESMLILSHSPCNGQRLLVIDNVDDGKLDLTPFLPSWRNGAVIVTSRNTGRGKMSPASHLSLDVMSSDESIELILRGTGREGPPSDPDKQSALTVAKEMGYHPIALAQATSYMSLTGASAETYISRLKSHRTRMLEDPVMNQVPMRYQTAFAAFDASYEIMPSKSRNFYHLLPFLHWRNFPLELVELGAKDSFSTDSWDYLARGDEFECGKQYLETTFCSSKGLELPRLDEMVASLRNHSLVTVTSAGDTILLQMHPLIHEWARLRNFSGDDGQLRAAAVRLLCCGAGESNYSMMQYLANHVEELLASRKDLHINDLASFAHILREVGLCAKSAELLEIVHTTLENQPGVDSDKIVTSCASLASVYGLLGEYIKAEQLQEQVLRQREDLLGTDHIQTITARANLAVTYHNMRRLETAREFEERVVEQRERTLGVDHPDTILAHANLSVTYSDLGRHRDAEVRKVDVLQRRTALLGRDHRHTILASELLATTYLQLGRHEDALELMMEVCDWRKPNLGVNHPDTILALVNLAAAYWSMGCHDKACELEKQALSCQKELPGPEHPSTLDAAANLAATYRDSGRLEEAERLFTEVLESKKSVLGAHHAETLRTMISLAMTYQEMQRPDEALTLAEEAARLASLKLGESDPVHEKAIEILASLTGNPTQLPHV